MDLIKAFTYIDTDHTVNIKGTSIDPLFQANQIGALIDIKNIHTTIRDFDSDEKILHTTDTLGGQQETTFLTELGLYRLLGMSRKPIARKFQKWVANVIKEIRIKSVDEKNKFQQNLEEITRELDEKTRELARLQKRNQKKFERGDRVYVYEDNTNDGLVVYKVGFSKDLASRVVAYDTTRFENRLKFDVMCANGRVLESTVHHMLRKFQDTEKNEWFHTSLEHVISTIKIAQELLDNFIYVPINNLETTMNGIYTIMNANKENVPANETIGNHVTSDVDGDVTCVSSTENELLEKFVTECFEEGPDYITKSAEVISRFRFWNKGISTKLNANLSKYMKSKYAMKREWNNQEQTAQLAYKGIKLIDIKYTPKGEPNEYDKYIKERCVVASISRTPIFNITRDFMEWKSNKGFILDGEKQEYNKMRSHLLNHFLCVAGTIRYGGKQESGGVWGLALKDYKYDNTTRKSHAKRKVVYKIDPATNEVIDTYESLTCLSKSLNNDMFHKVKNGILHEGFLYSYSRPDETAT